MKNGYYSYKEGKWVYYGVYVNSPELRESYNQNNPVYGFNNMTGWRQMIVPGRWRPLKEEPKPLQMMRLIGAI